MLAALIDGMNAAAARTTPAACRDVRQRERADDGGENRNGRNISTVCSA